MKKLNILLVSILFATSSVMVFPSAGLADLPVKRVKNFDKNKPLPFSPRPEEGGYNFPPSSPRQPPPGVQKPPSNSRDSSPNDKEDEASRTPVRQPVAPPPPVVVQPGGGVFAAISLLDKELARDGKIVQGEMTLDRLLDVRDRLAYDLEIKNSLLKVLEKEGKSVIKPAVEIIKMTAEVETSLAATKSTSSGARRKMQKRIKVNIDDKQQALAILKKEAGE